MTFEPRSKSAAWGKPPAQQPADIPMQAREHPVAAAQKTARSPHAQGGVGERLLPAFGAIALGFNTQLRRQRHEDAVLAGELTAEQAAQIEARMRGTT